MDVRTRLCPVKKQWWFDILRGFTLNKIWKLLGHNKVCNIFNCVKDFFLSMSSSVFREHRASTLKRMVAQLLLLLLHTLSLYVDNNLLKHQYNIAFSHSEKIYLRCLPELLMCFFA